MRRSSVAVRGAGGAGWLVAGVVAWALAVADPAASRAVPPVGRVEDPTLLGLIERAREAAKAVPETVEDRFLQRGLAVERVLTPEVMERLDARGIYGAFMATDVQFAPRSSAAAFDRLERLMADDGPEGVKAAGVAVSLSRSDVAMERERLWLGRLLRHPQAAVYFGGRSGVSAVPDLGRLRRGAVEPYLAELADLPRYWGEQSMATAPHVIMYGLYSSFVAVAGDGRVEERERLRQGLARVARETLAKLRAPRPEGQGAGEGDLNVRWLREVERTMTGPALTGELFKPGAKLPPIELKWVGGGGGVRPPVKPAGGPMRLADLAGRPVLLVWFDPEGLFESRLRADLDAVQARHADKGLVVLAIAAGGGSWGKRPSTPKPGEDELARAALEKFVAEKSPSYVVGYAGREDGAAEFGATFFLPRVQFISARGVAVPLPGRAGMAGERQSGWQAVVDRELGAKEPGPAPAR